MEGEPFWSLALSALNSNNQTLALPIENEPESCVVPTIYIRHSGGQSTQPGPTRQTRALIRQLRPYRTAICQQAGHFSSVFLEIHILFNHDTIYEAASLGNATKVYNVLFRYDSVLETRRTLPVLHSGSPSRIYRTIFCISEICFGSGFVSFVWWRWRLCFPWLQNECWQLSVCTYFISKFTDELWEYNSLELQIHLDIAAGEGLWLTSVEGATYTAAGECIGHNWDYFLSGVIRHWSFASFHADSMHAWI